ncbi:hypothetical protein [Streptomyces sp. NPDC088725]|uniref:COG1470 family protein n=1 Tax=Streptomyces sp. NPDC088725 TaxID=3365873 RepID=UPI0038157949
MSLTASLDESSVFAPPGEETSLPLQVHNSGSTVEEYRFEVVGACVAWATVEPQLLALYPGSSETVSLKLRPPRDSSVPAGETAFGIRVVPTSEPGEAVVPEGWLTVTPFTEVTRTPPYCTSRWRTSGTSTTTSSHRSWCPQVEG